MKRVYDEPSEKDGNRILVDGLWPRGLRKEKARIDYWAKDVAPSAELRKWFNHDPEKWNKFKNLYYKELVSKSNCIDKLLKIIGSRESTFLFSSREPRFNNAVALREFLLSNQK